jgi:hypothetical protein
MRSTGLLSADWAVITEYINCLQPLKNATSRLEGRGKTGKFGALYEIIPVFEYLLGALEISAKPFEHVNFNAHAEAPEDHLVINLKAAWRKANEYYTKLGNVSKHRLSLLFYTLTNHIPSTLRNQTTSPLLRLPAELRNIIYI